MKVMNIAFSGFAAMILVGVCGVASAATYNLASKDYVDTQLAGKASIEDFENLESTVDKKATQEALKEVADQVVLNTNDIAELKAAGYITDTDLDNLKTTLQAAIDDKQAKGNYALAEDLTQLSESIAELESGMLDAETVAGIQTAIDNLGETYATKDEMTVADTALWDAIRAINVPSLEGYAKTADLAKVATTGQYSDLEGKPEIPSIEGLAKSSELTQLQETLQAAIDKKQDSGQYLVAADLIKLENDIATLQSGKADLATVTAIQTAIDKLGETYATDVELTAAIDTVKLLIPTIPTNVSAFTNDTGYITETALTPYAKTADVEMVENKLATATAEDIAAMSSDEKATKYPSIAVSQTIANAAVTKVNEFAGDLTELETKVETNTADIAELGDTVDEVEVIALAAIPKPGKICQAASGSCALTVDTEGNLTWAVIAGVLNGN